MKNIVLGFSFLLFYFSGFSQDSDEEKIISELTQKIEQSQKGERLKYMDSLSTYIATKTRFENDSIVRETIEFAIQLDSFRIATRQTGQLIYYNNNIAGTPEIGNEIFIEFLPNTIKTNNNRALARYYLEGADSFYFIKDHENAIKYYEQSINAAEKAGDEKYAALAKLYKGGSLSLMGKFSDASQILQESAILFQKTKDTFNNISAKNSLSILYSQNGFFEEAKAERDEAIELAKAIKSNEHLVSFYYNAATDARKIDAGEDEVAYLKKAIEANEKTRSKDVYISTLYANLISAYVRQDSVSKGAKLLEFLENNAEKYTKGANYENYLHARKHMAFGEKNFNQAIDLGLEHLEIKSQGMHYEEAQLAEKFLADVYEEVGDKEAAFKHFKNYTTYKDSISNVQKIKGLSYYQTLYETEKRDATIKEQNINIALLDAKDKIKNQWLLFGGLGLLSVFGITLLIRSSNASKRRQRMQEGFSQNLILAQEQERTRVSRELHDSVGQKLMLLTKKTKSNGDVEMGQLADTTLEELRSISRGLHPATMDQLGVTRAIESMINEVDANSNIFFTNEIENIDALLSKEVSLHVYRIIQETLNNMVKHSEAKAASVKIQQKDGVIHAIIKDNGKGFKISEKLENSITLGMKTLAERAKIIKSELIIDSALNSGTTTTLIIPT